MVKTFCDKCEKEIKEGEIYGVTLRSIKLGVRNQRLQLCKECGEQFKKEWNIQVDKYE